MPAASVTSRITLRNILFATDFSDVSKAALPYAMDLARLYDGKIVVAHVVPHEAYLSVPLEPLPIDLDLMWNREKQELADFTSRGSFGSVPHEDVLQRGDLWEVIADIIETRHIDLVVTGTRGRSGLKKMVLGSTAERIYRKAHCPVLTIGPEAAETRRAGWELKRILFATDFSETSLHALPFALSLAEENQANLIFLNVAPLTPYLYKEAVEASTRRKLEVLMPAEPWCSAEFVVSFEFPAQGILQVAGERNADLIVMGVKKPVAAGLTSHLPWSIASDVVGAASCPVLTVRG
ncbi:MAG: universal stress protein [Terriglobales bacterium]